MNTKLFPAASLAALMAFAGAGCGDNGGGGTTDTTTTDTSHPDGTAGDTTGGDTSGGDSTPTDTAVQPDVSGTPGTVVNAQVEATAVTCDPQGFVNVNPQESLNDVVVTTGKFDASAQKDGTVDGYYVADQGGGAYSGILLRIEAANRPSTDLQPGDVVDVTGLLEEVFCWTQLEVHSITVKTPVAAPAPVVVPNPADLANEAYESMLVKVDNVTIEAASAQGGHKISGTDVSIGFAFPGFIGLTDGQSYDITGVIGVSFGTYQLIPRGPSDVVLKSTTSTTIEDIQSSAISLACPDVNAMFVNGASGVSLSGTILVGTFGVTATLDGYILTDGTQDPYSAVLINVSNSPKTAFQAGDQVTLTGDHQEFFCNTQIRASVMTKTGSGGTLPDPVHLAANPSNDDLEKYESMLVEMSDVTASTYDATARQVGTDAGVGIDYGIMGTDAFASGAAIVGKKLTTLRGIVRFSRGTFRISPRNADDMVLAQ